MRERLPFLFIQCRPAGKIARDELQTIAEVTGLRIGQELHSYLLPEQTDLDLVRDLDFKNRYSAVIISGSPFRAQPPTGSDNPLQRQLYNQLMPLMHYLLDQDFPTLGLCYGLQMLGQAAGATLTDRTGEDLQAVEVTLTAKGHKDPVTGQLDPVIRGYTTAGMQIRIDQYGDAYYVAAEREAVIARCMSQDVTSSHRLLSAFTEHYRR